MAGRRIRWANAGRAAAIAAAVLAGLATLPALLGEDEPPPLPEDVGLGGVAPAAPAPVPPTPAAHFTAKPPQAMPAGQREAKRRPKRGGGKRGADVSTPGAARRRARHGETEPESEPPEPAAPYVPAYIPPSTPAASSPGREDFRIED
jgi:hypothetical protein